MAFPQATKLRVCAALLLATAVALLGLALKNSFANASYDSLHSRTGIQPSATADSPVVIVYLDLASFSHEHQNPAQPWPRDLHAKLLKRLTAAGAKAVVFDIVFGNAGPNPAADQAFTEAIRENGHVVLAAEFNSSTIAPDDQHNWARKDKIEPIFAPFDSAAATRGIASLHIDDDNVVRQYLAGFGSDSQSTLTWATASWLRLPVAKTAKALAEANQKWVRYYGPPMTIPHISYSQALAADGVRDDFFRDKIVFIGARPQVGLFQDSKDEFRNPFHSWSYKNYFMPGVEVHATEMLNLVRNDALQRVAPMTENFLLLVVAISFGGGLIWWRPLPATLIALGGAALTPLISRAFFNYDHWFPWLVICAGQIPAALFGSWLWQFQEWFFTRRKMEAAKKIADAKIREQAALIDKAHDAILVQNLAGKIIYANPSAEKLFGGKHPTPNTQQRTAKGTDASTRDSILDVSELFSADAAAAEIARAAALKDGEWNGELKIQTRTGDLIIAASRWTLIRDDTGKPDGLLLINSDITEQKNLEQQFLRTQRMNTIGTLAGGMAHDLNNALAPVLMGAQWLRRKSGDEEDRQMLAMIETSAHRGADMVRQVLLFARGRGGEFERLDLAPVMQELEKMVRETFPKNISVETFLPRDLWPVQGNITQLHQVFLNLCVNARDAMPDGGKISFIADNVEFSAEELENLPKALGSPTGFSLSPLRAERAEVRGQNAVGSSDADTASNDQADPASSIPLPSEARAKSEVRPPLKFVSLSISDTGTGMSPAVQAKMFEPFFTTKGEGQGTGIGLATVIRIVKSHGGLLRVESEVGHGTTFEIFLPHATEVPTTPAAKAEVTLPRGHGELILVADDELALCELVAAELKEFGYRVLTATNGAEAVALCKQHASELRLFITDDSMPVLNGRQAIGEIRKLRADLPVITTSGDGAKYFAGVSELNKPFALGELLNAVSRSLK